MKNILERCEGFQWDSGNDTKNWTVHKVSDSECEQAFFNKPVIVTQSVKAGSNENRWCLLSRTDSNRKLFLVFTIRGKLIRIISARDMSKKEREIYYEEAKKYTGI